MIARRSFLKSLVGIVASVALAQRVVLDSFAVTAQTEEESTRRVNPAWKDAQYESYLIFHPAAMEAYSDGHKPLKQQPEERWVFVGGTVVPIPKYLP